MTNAQIASMRAHFLEWSGGFEPESQFQITVYVDYAADQDLDADEVRSGLEDWAHENSRRDTCGQNDL